MLPRRRKWIEGRRKKKEKRRNGDAESERNSEPLVSETRFSGTIRHRIWAENEGEEDQREREKGSERGSERSDPTEREHLGGPYWIGQGPWIFPFVCSKAPRIYVTDTCSTSRGNSRREWLQLRDSSNATNSMTDPRHRRRDERLGSRASRETHSRKFALIFPDTLILGLADSVSFPALLMDTWF